MGRSYTTELACLTQTFDWASQVENESLVTAVEASFEYPLVVTGSGGSLTAAHFAVLLHQQYAKRIAKAITPLEMVSTPEIARDVAVLVLSAGGRNADIIGAFTHALQREPRQTTVLCGKPDSPLSRKASSVRAVDLCHLSPPSGKDGFLATNSLLAFSIVLCRAYQHVSKTAEWLPTTMAELMEVSPCASRSLETLKDRYSQLWEREYLVVLHGTTTQAAAYDLESKFTEAALGGVQIADYRNFAHGRHHWLAKRGSQSAVLSLITDDDRELADRTLALIPEDVPVVRVDVHRRGPAAGLAMMIHALQIVGSAGNARGIDPGRPGVPAFGRRMYHLRALSTHGSAKRLPSTEDTAIERKSGAATSQLMARGDIDYWRNAYRTFLKKLRRSSFAGLVLDYDGTLCDSHDRYQGIGAEVAAEVQRLLQGNIVIGIATGRGKSAREDLRQKIDQSLWDKIVVGYYNGSEIGLLANDDCPSQRTTPSEELASVAEALTTDRRLISLAKCTVRHEQITVEPMHHFDAKTVWDVAFEIVLQQSSPGISVLRSGHSVDVLAPGVSKKTFVNYVSRLLDCETTMALLCIGDQGRWPGNDCSLLAEPCSLSVDEVSTDPTTCWNLAAPGIRGVDATIAYLRSLAPESEEHDCLRWQG